MNTKAYSPGARPWTAKPLEYYLRIQRIDWTALKRERGGNEFQFTLIDPEISEKIIELLSKKASVNVKITFKGSSVEGVYDFNIEGSPELKKALKINTERKIQAQKEFEKEDAKIVKQLEDILS